MWLILQQDKPDDYVISTVKNYSVKEFCNYAFSFLDINLIWEGEGINE
jgi:GDPmannose 4,6-dehydratase